LGETGLDGKGGGGSAVSVGSFGGHFWRRWLWC
jgi:hypothetical protein